MESAEKLRKRTAEALVLVGRCLDAVDRINQLKDTRNQVQDQWGTLRCKPPAADASEEQRVAYDTEMRDLIVKGEKLTGEIDELYRPFAPAQDAVRELVEQLPGVLSATEMGGLKGRLNMDTRGRFSMRSAYDELDWVKRRLNEFCASGAQPLSQVPSDDGAETTAGIGVQFPRSIYSPRAAQRVLQYMQDNGLSRSQFADRVQRVTAKTIGKFLRTGWATPASLDDIAASMGTTKAKLLSSD